MLDFHYLRLSILLLLNIPKWKIYRKVWEESFKLYNLLQQTVTAFNQDMGITSYVFAHLNPTNYMEGIPDHQSGSKLINRCPGVLSPELYKFCATPIGRESAIIEGKILFTRVGCDACHRPTLKLVSHP